GVRLWVRPTGCGCAYTQVINAWNDHAPRWDNTANNPLGIPFTAGIQYDVWLEFYEHAGLAWIWLATSNSSAAVIPQSQFRVELMPATPTGLAGSAPASDRVNLTWTANPQATPQVSGYVIFRSTTSGFTPDQTTLIGSANTPAFTDYNRDSATTYYYKIAAIDTAGNISGFTAQISVTTP
ncbi:MAG TPA: fibronectin type III domain-containing protein, partial [Symbiobacteriaceae bacterium]|nr:fibronectin type III domain-containing protein [Symbiobacteriaceae bacterium]